LERAFLYFFVGTKHAEECCSSFCKELNNKGVLFITFAGTMDKRVS